MAAYDDDDLAPPPRSRERRPRGYDDGPSDPLRSQRTDRYDDPHPAARDGHRSRRRETYDASDEDDDVHRRPSKDTGRSSRRHRASDNSPIPRPPIGDDRNGMGAGGPVEYSEPKSSRRRHKTSSPSRRSRGDDYDRANGHGYSNGRDADRGHSLGPPPARHRSRRDRDDVDAFGAMDPRSRRRNGDDDRRDDHDDRRRDKRDRRRDDFWPPSRRKGGRDSDDDAGYGRHRGSQRSIPRDDDHRRPPRDHRSRRYDDPEETEYDAPPRRRRGGGPRHRDRYDERGYASENPHRRDRDDYDRGYRTDGRDPRRGSQDDRRRDRDRDRDRDRRSSRRDDDNDDRDDDDNRDRRGSKRKGSGVAPDLDKIVEGGQKTWNKVQPVAKPMLAALANKYLG